MDSFFTARPKFAWPSFLFFLSLLVTLLGVVGYGSTVLIEASHKTRVSQISLLKDQIELWNESMPGFVGMHVELSAQNSSVVVLAPDQNDDFHFKGVKLPPYPHYKYYANTTLLSSTATLKAVASIATVSPTQPEVFNFTTNLTLQYSMLNRSDQVQTYQGVVVFQKAPVPLNQKSKVHLVCDMHHDGLWEARLNVCIRHFMVAALCFVFNSSEQAVDLVGCPKDVQGWRVYPWSKAEPPTNFTHPVLLFLRSDMDPLVFAERSGAGKLSPSSTEFLIMGALLVVIGCLFLIIPIIYFWQLWRPRDRLLRKYDLEMSNMREGYAPRF